MRTLEGPDVMVGPCKMSGICAAHAAQRRRSSRGERERERRCSRRGDDLPFALGEGERSRRAGGERDLDLRRVDSFLEAGDEEDEEEEDEESESDSDEEEEEELSSLPSLNAVVSTHRDA